MHSRKRQFQPTIDTFFAREEQCLPQQASPATTSTAPGSASHAQRRPPPSTPSLPATVQASLLTVGMRVRKAVPEGYKTHKTSLFSDPTVPRAAPALSRSAKSSRPAELLPFCGLHKVGGLRVQEPVDAFAEREGSFEHPAENGLLVSSQESGVSSVSMDEGVGNSRKRLFGYGPDDDDNDEEEEEDYEGVGEENVSFVDGEEMATRVYARPRTRRLRALGGEVSSASLGDVVQRNNCDWEEADFLESWDAEMDGT